MRHGVRFGGQEILEWRAACRFPRGRFYEAALATLAILVWHFYSVIFDPDVYPLDTAAITGFSTRPRDTESTSSEIQEELTTKS